jgi:hypothetical protein
VVTPTRVRDLVGYALGVALVAWLAVRQWYGDLPRLNWAVPLTLVLLAVAETITANNLRARIRRRPGARPVEPLAAARALALAKASALVGAVTAGAWTGLLIHVVPRLDTLAAAPGDTRTGVVGVVAAVALTCAALWLERACRAPTPPDGKRPIGPNGAHTS